MKILFQDQQLIVIDKPAGLSVLPDGWEKDSEYLVKILEEQYDKVFIVHRLDKITSGVMVFARDAETHRALNIQFENHDAQKAYHAIVEGNPKWEEKVAKHPLRANVGHKHRTMVDDRNTLRDALSSNQTISGSGTDRSETHDRTDTSDPCARLRLGASAGRRCPLWRHRHVRDPAPNAARANLVLYPSSDKG